MKKSCTSVLDFSCERAIVESDIISKSSLNGQSESVTLWFENLDNSNAATFSYSQTLKFKKRQNLDTKVKVTKFSDDFRTFSTAVTGEEMTMGDISQKKINKMAS